MPKAMDPEVTDTDDAVGPDVEAADVMQQLGLNAGHTAIVGTQWGDEGKGQIVNLLTDRFDFVIRYNGGNNAGHSVHIGDQKFALHLLPSGIISPTTMNVVANGVVVDPKGILDEIDGLAERGLAIGDNLRISNRAHVVFPYHRAEDGLYDLAIARAAGDDRQIGTTMRGIGPCYADKALRSTAVRMGQLLRPDELRSKLSHIVSIKNLLLGALAGQCDQEFVPFDADALADEYIEYGKRLAGYICDTTTLLHDAMADGKQMLFEGANANLLDVDHGTYPFVTSSNCSSLGIYPGAAIPGGALANVVGIAKLYTSRVGGGPFPTELHDESAERIREAGNEYGTTTGRPRRCGWLDSVAIKYATAVSGVTALACTGLAVLAGIDPLKVCVGYRLNGQRTDRFPADAGDVAAVEPIYEELPGFADTVDTCRSFDQLPPEAKAYVQFIEDTVGVPIRVVCVGRRRDQILVR